MFKSLRGHLLIATPSLGGSDFQQTVILLIRHSAEGAFGLVLNRPGDSCVADLWDKVATTPCRQEGPLFLGGPIDGPLTVVHDDAAHADTKVVEGVYFSPDREAIEQVIGSAGTQVKVFVGYAGWGPEQLESELQQGVWLTCEAARDAIFSDTGTLWARMMKAAHERALLRELNIHEIPSDPRLN